MLGFGKKNNVCVLCGGRTEDSDGTLAFKAPDPDTGAEVDIVVGKMCKRCSDTLDRADAEIVEVSVDGEEAGDGEVPEDDWEEVIEHFDR